MPFFLPVIIGSPLFKKLEESFKSFKPRTRFLLMLFWSEMVCSFLLMASFSMLLLLYSQMTGRSGWTYFTDVSELTFIMNGPIVYMFFQISFMFHFIFAPKQIFDGQCVLTLLSLVGLGNLSMFVACLVGMTVGLYLNGEKVLPLSGQSFWYEHLKPEQTEIHDLSSLISFNLVLLPIIIAIVIQSHVTSVQFRYYMMLFQKQRLNFGSVASTTVQV